MLLHSPFKPQKDGLENQIFPPSKIFTEINLVLWQQLLKTPFPNPVLL